MPKLKKVDFSRWIDPPVTKQYVNKLINEGQIYVEDDLIDTDHPINAVWITARRERITGEMLMDSPENDVMVDEILRKLATLDIRQVTKAEIDKIKGLESALKTRVERQQKRGELISRDFVQSVFGKLYQIDSNELRVISSVVAPEIAGVLGVDDDEKVLEIEKIIDDRILKVIAHVKRVLNDALKSWGAPDGVE